VILLFYFHEDPVEKDAVKIKHEKEEFVELENQ
jgi:hypothetical protein